MIWHIQQTYDEVAEWLRRWTANPMCSARVGSNPILVEEMYVVHVHRNGYDMSFYHVDPYFWLELEQ